MNKIIFLYLIFLKFFFISNIFLGTLVLFNSNIFIFAKFIFIFICIVTGNFPVISIYLKSSALPTIGNSRVLALAAAATHGRRMAGSSSSAGRKPVDHVSPSFDQQLALASILCRICLIRSYRNLVRFVFEGNLLIINLFVALANF